jgi:competence ComEA-like helix-hairpin-helix protein
MVVLLVLAVGLLSAHVLSSLRWGSRPTNLEHGLGYRIDLNQADEAELLQLPGIGPNRVKQILKYRNAHGGFRTVDELRNVHGIGTATLETLRQWVCVGFDQADEENESMDGGSRRPRAEGKGRGKAVGGDKPRPRSGKKGATLKEKININRATAEQLRLLPFIGEKLALRIIAERQKRRFQSVEDLKRVRGIKDGILAQVRPYATVSRKPERVVPQD